MEKVQALQNLKDAIATNNRIANAKIDIEREEKDIKSLKLVVENLMLDCAIKQMRVDALKKELENAVEIKTGFFEDELTA